MSKIWITGYWLRSQLWHVTAANQCTIMNHCWNWAFSSSGLEVGLPAFQLPMFAKCDALKEICSTCLSKESTPFVRSKPPLPTRSLRFLRATVSSTSSAWWLHHAHPFVAASEKSTCLMQRSKALCHAVAVSKIFYNTVISVIVLSVVLWDCCKLTNTCRDWAFINSGLEVGLPAFQLPMFAKCDALPKGDLLDMFV